MKNNQPDIIEVKEDATDEQIELLQKCNPDSLILRSDDSLEELYNKARTITYEEVKWAIQNYKSNFEKYNNIKADEAKIEPLTTEQIYKHCNV